MTLTERRLSDVTLLHLAGRLVYDEGDIVLRTRVNELVAEGRLKIVVDLQDVTTMDSCGVGELVARLVSVRQKGGDMKLLRLTHRSHRVMQISRLLDVFESFDSEDEAVARFSAQRGA
jgi:anti-sigma B factor antagonist